MATMAQPGTGGVELRKCQYARCNEAAYYGYKEDAQPSYCAQHRAGDMVNFLQGGHKVQGPAPPGEIPIYAQTPVYAPNQYGQQYNQQQQQQYGQQQYGQHDVEANAYYGQAAAAAPTAAHPGTQEAFANEQIRRAFMAKVFGIVLIQLTITTAIIVVCRFNDAAHNYIQNNTWIYWTSFAVAFAALIVLVCSGNARKAYPFNMIILSIITLAFAFLLAVITAWYDADIVAYALLITCSVVAACVVLASCCKMDFTKLGGVLMILMVGLLVALFIGIFWANNTLYIVIGSIGAVLFSLFLIHDIQLIMGGRRHELGPDEYILAALMLYLDIINIFQYILLILGATSN